MELQRDNIQDPFKTLEVSRPWGFYGLYSDNEECTAKILYIKRGEALSLQFHFLRDQFYLVLDDTFVIDYSDRPVPESILNEPIEEVKFRALEEFLKQHKISSYAKEGDMFGFKRRIIHRARYTGPREMGRILDVAFGKNDEEDIVRIQDKYGRV